MCDYIYFKKFEEPDVDLIEIGEVSGRFAVVCFNCNIVIDKPCCHECAERQLEEHIEWHEWFSSRQAISVFEPRCQCYESFVANLGESELKQEDKRVRALGRLSHELWMSGDPTKQKQAAELEHTYSLNPIPDQGLESPTS
jgi:hypothetical protein